LRLAPWRAIFLVFGIKFIALAFLWLAAASFIFWPAAKAYEWLLLEETRAGAASSDWLLRCKRILLRWPFGARFSIFALLILGFWIFLLQKFAPSLQVGLIAFGSFVGVHFLFTLLSIGCKKMRAAWGRRKAMPPILRG
jgi:hypothetical protein